MRPKVFFYSVGPNPWLLLWTVLIAAGLLAAAGGWGLAKVAEWVLPSLSGLAVIGLGVFAMILPLSLVPRWRPSLMLVARWIASTFGLGVWMASFLVLWKWLSFFAIPFILLSFLSAPVAILRLVWIADYSQAAAILAAAILARVIRSYASWLGGSSFKNINGPRPGSHAETTEVIDTVAVPSPAGELEQKDRPVE